MEFGINLWNLLAGVLLVWCVQIKGEEETIKLPPKLRKRHVELLPKLSNYKLVRPYRSTQDGEFLTHDLSTEFDENQYDYLIAKRDTIRRRKRSPNNSRPEWTNETEDPVQPHFNFAVDAFGEKITLDLTRNDNIASQGFRVTMNMEDGEQVTYRPRTNCFYTGHVQNSVESTVAISNCDGLEGLIKADDEEYVIEPLEVPSEKTSNVTEGHVHIMYRRTDVKDGGGYFNYTHPRLFDDEALPDDLGVGPEPRPETDSSNSRHKRQSSSYDRNYHIEVMIVADQSVRDFHGDGPITTYLMTMMHIVNMVFSDSSLGTRMDLTVINIVLLNSGQSKNMVVENNPASSLANICQYSYDNQDPNEAYWGHYDYAAFLTRVNFGPAGYAPVGAMCNPYRSCSLTKDEGILSAMVIAHETGHVLGMEHDGQMNACYEESQTGSIMAPIVNAVYNNYFFSDCSRTEMHSYLWRYTCLLDDPYDSSSTYVPVQEFPGERYTMDDQCRFDFGEGWDVCIFWDDTNPCDQLLCNHYDDEYWCKTKRSPPLDGTECDTDKWCMGGACVYKSVIDGEWGGWSSWSECSYDCGVGAQYRTRLCDSPAPDRGGDPCKGESVGYGLCNIQDCEVKQDRRAVQCEEDLANWFFQGIKHTWLPFESRNRTLACKLTCISEKTQDVVMTEYNVRDGTPCSYDDHESICIQGECVTIGCNNNLEEPMRADVCGVCDGDYTKCELVKGSFVELPKGVKAGKYQLILTVPAGARNVEIKDMNGAKHFLAMKEKGQNYILNKKKKQSASYDFIFVGARFVYVNEGKEEMLWSKGPILKKIAIALFWTGDVRPANITYQYYMNSLETESAFEPTKAPPEKVITVTPPVVDKQQATPSEVMPELPRTTLAPESEPELETTQILQTEPGTTKGLDTKAEITQGPKTEAEVSEGSFTKPQTTQKFESEPQTTEGLGTEPKTTPGLDKIITTNPGLEDNPEFTTPELDKEPNTTPEFYKEPTTTPEIAEAPITTPEIAEAPITTPESDEVAITTLDPALVIPDVGTNPNFIWEPIGWTECTQSCGGGKQYFRYQCRPRNGKKRVRAKKCGQKGYNSKGIVRECNTQSCPVSA